ncbi:DUF2280 domain-containing protein [Sinorhizobium americanum]|uniref:Phage terminase, large subunit n=1 Tax=Sinorhizobium americanum TaxID=194963 RepID=A0A1L3LM30_9HYPH|nr:DUF2280 domain-containing protein [Sinorhizobium americanum]APG91137.1 phage terminase, large subunit [Sinorhizobium americanum]OAP43717.1 hypothetical protein ATC00_02425 [Sinorhizobium americanum]
MAKGKLKDEVKTFIVQSLACFDTPSIVVEAVRKEYGETITRQSVEGYDPTKKAGGNLAVKWKLLFEETRKTFLEDTATIAISHRAVRLRALQRMAEKAETQGNMVLAASLMKQAAEEVGNAYTNRRELTGKDGKDLPVPVSPVTIFQLPDNGRG